MQDGGSADLRDYCVTMSQLIECLRRLFHKWLEYEDLVDSVPVRSASYQAPLSQRPAGLNGPGITKFTPLDALSSKFTINLDYFSRKKQ